MGDSLNSPTPAYQSLFWRPFLGNVAFSLWDVLRALDLNGDGLVEVPITITELAQLIGIGDRSTVLGRQKTETRPQQVGALERLVDENLVRFVSTGPDKFHRRFTFWVIQNPPRLTAAQVSLLNPAVRDLHTRFVGVRSLEEIPNYYTKPWPSHSKNRLRPAITYDPALNLEYPSKVAQVFQGLGGN